MLAMKQFIIAGSLLAAFGASAAGLPCSIHPPKGVADSALPALAKVSKADAPIETYKMTLASSGGKQGTLTLAWENTVASVQFTVQ